MTDSKLPAPEPSGHPVDVGLRSEAAILSELVRRGYSVLIPFGVNQRYDLVLDLNGDFVRVQCKTGRLRRGSVEFSTQSVRSNTKRAEFRGYRGEAEYFLVFCPANNGIYAVPVDAAPGRNMHLRLSPALNGQKRGVNLASEYELPA